MHILDLHLNSNVVCGHVRVFLGVEEALLEQGSNLRTYVLALRGGTLEIGTRSMQIPPRCVTVLAPGVRATFRSEDRSIEELVLRVPSVLPPLPAATNAFLKTRGVRYAIDNTEAHEGIIERPDLGVRVLPKYVADGGKVRGWACNLHKGEPIGIDAGTEWTAVRAAEDYHYHEHTHETYVILDGTGRFRIDDELVDLPRGMIFSCPPALAHKVESVAPGASGVYTQVTFHYPQVPPEAKDKIVVPE